MTIHAEWEELAAGRALDALEPEDDAAFAGHLRGCDLCARTLAELRTVAARLAYGTPPSEPPAGLTRRVRALAGPDVRARPRRTVPAGGIAAVAALVVILGLALWNLALRQDADAGRRAAASRTAALRCVAAAGTPKARLLSGGTPRGTACVDGAQVYLVAESLTRNDPRGSVYVLWWGDGAGTLHPVDAFDVTSSGLSVVALPLPAAPGAIRAFLVSLESSRTVPDSPGLTVAYGRIAP